MYAEAQAAARSLWKKMDRLSFGLALSVYRLGRNPAAANTMSRVIPATAVSAATPTTSGFTPVRTMSRKLVRSPTPTNVS